MKTLRIFMVVLAAAISPVIAQQPPGSSVAVTNDLKWARVETEDGELSAAFPPGFIFDGEKRSSDQRHRVVGFQNGVMMELRVIREESPKSRLRNILHNEGYAATGFKKDDFEGKRSSAPETDREFFENIYLASRKNLYQLQVRSAGKDAAEIKQFLHSIRLDGKPLFSSSGAVNSPPEEPPVSISSLKTSPEVVEAARRKIEKNKITAVRKPGSPQPAKYEYGGYSRPPIILEKPFPGFRPPFSELAERAVTAKQYSAHLRLTLLADGQVGDITAYSNSDSAFVNSCVEAAGKIRFIPARANGVNVDSTDVIGCHMSVALVSSTITTSSPISRPF